MTNTDLARSYIWKAETRIDALEALFKRGNYSDVVREAQETVERVEGNASCRGRGAAEIS
jgi:hypothetical protein